MTETRDHLLRPKPPYRLDLVVRALRRRPDNPVDRWDGRAWSRTVAVGGTVCRWTVRQDGPVEEPLLAARLELEPPLPAGPAPGAQGAAPTGEATAWARLALDRLLGLSVDLSDFQAFADRDRPLRELAARWRGFRPPRFPTLFEALLNAVACQQITLTQGIRRLGALAARFGRNGRALPEPADLLGAPLPALRELGFSRQRAETLLRLAEHALAQVHPATYRRALQAMQGFDRWAQAWVNVHTPTLLVGGEADHCTPPAALEALAQLMPDARHLSLPHVGHWPQLENPEAFDAALLDFLATQRVLH